MSLQIVALLSCIIKAFYKILEGPPITELPGVFFYLVTSNGKILIGQDTGIFILFSVLDFSNAVQL